MRVTWKSYRSSEVAERTLTRWTPSEEIAPNVSSHNQSDCGGCQLAFLELKSELAGLAPGRIAAFREQEGVDPDIDEIWCWAYFVARYFDPWLNLVSTEAEQGSWGGD